jgi:hypothetical protein
LNSFDNPEERALARNSNKIVYLRSGNSGFTVQDVVCTEVNIQRGSISWMVNGRTVAEYHAEYIKNKEMVPFISMLDFYDEAYLLGS